MAGERRLYLERNCRLPESPAHRRRRNREGPASSKGLNSQRGFGPAVEPRRKSRPRSTSLHGSSPCKCQRLSTLRWDRLPPSRPSTKSGARAGGRRLSDRRLHRWLAGTSASAPSSHGAADLLGLNRAHICVRNQFYKLARSWMQNPGQLFLNFIWSGYEHMKMSRPVVDGSDLERSITQLLEPRIREAMTGDEPFYIQHGPYERETMKAPPAQPPEYDLAFVFRADGRIMWPIEAKVLETPRRVAAYVRDVKGEFLTCRYAPFSGSGAMLGYLLTGSPKEVFIAIEKGLGCVLQPVTEAQAKPNRLSRHKRSVPTGKPYPVEFACYHLILEYPDLRRSAKSGGSG